MREKILALKERIINDASKESFRHYKWFVKYHLEVVERLALEISEMYTDINIDLLLTLVWIHDYGSIIDYENSKEALFNSVPTLLTELDFENDFIDNTFNKLKISENITGDEEIESLPIEVRILSTADAVSHLFGPFYFLWWYENGHREVEDVLEDNRKKNKKDWEKKILIPEIKEMMKDRNDFMKSLIDIPINKLLKK